MFNIRKLALEKTHSEKKLINRFNTIACLMMDEQVLLDTLSHFVIEFE